MKTKTKTKHNYGTAFCKGCGAEFAKTGSRSERCAPCARERRKKRRRDYYALKVGPSVVKIGELMECKRCKKQITRRNNTHKYCKSCLGTNRNKYLVRWRRARGVRPVPTHIDCKVCGKRVKTGAINRLYCGKCLVLVNRRNVRNYVIKNGATRRRRQRITWSDTRAAKDFLAVWALGGVVKETIKENECKLNTLNK